MSAAEAARLCGLSEKTVRRWIQAGKLRADKRDGAYSVALSDVSALVGGVSAPASAHVSVPESVQEAAHVSAPGADTPEDDVRPSDQPSTDIMRAEAMASYTRSVLEPLVAALERSQGRVSELERENGGLAKENGTLAERMAGLERVRDAAMAHAAELEARLAVPPVVPEPVPDPFPVPNPPSPNVVPRRGVPRWRRWWLAIAGAGLVAVVGASCGQRVSVKNQAICAGATRGMGVAATAFAQYANKPGDPGPMGTGLDQIDALLSIVERTC